MNTKYMLQTHANISTNNLKIEFYRLHEQRTDPMSDDPRPNWYATDDFEIKITPVSVSEEAEDHGDFSYVTRRKHFDKPVIFYGDRDFANQIWKTAKKYDDYDTVVKEAKRLSR